MKAKENKALSHIFVNRGVPVFSPKNKTNYCKNKRCSKYDKRKKHNKKPHKILLYLQNNCKCNKCKN